MDSIDAPDRSPTARTGSEPSSDLTLRGLLRHSALVEQWWFERVFAGLDPALYYQDEGDPDADFHRLGDETLRETVEKLSTSCERSRELVADRSLDELAKAPWGDQPVNLRWILIHMIEEYARHCGHADLLRELLDGVTGY
jgi:uncharacterized damage-inducible protein DinB